MSHDFEDVVSVIDGRRELFYELCQCEGEEREFLNAEFDRLLADAEFLNTVEGLIRPSTPRRKQFILRRMRLLANMATSSAWLADNHKYLKWAQYDEFVRVGHQGNADIFLVSASVVEDTKLLIKLCQAFAREVDSFCGRILMWIDPNDVPDAWPISREQSYSQVAEFAFERNDGLQRLRLMKNGTVQREIIADAN